MLTQPIRIFTFSLLIVLALVNGEGTGTYNGYKAPKYTILESTTNYELREYGETNWVATSGSFRFIMFWRLFSYIRANKIKMTVPVAMKIVGTPKKETMHFFLMTANNPKPKHREVSLVSFPKQKVYVRRYTGMSTTGKQEANLKILKQSVGADKYNDEYYFYCGYDAPYTMKHRRNEVWLLAKQ